MRFLALSPLQTVLLAVFTAGTIIALYFLKLRHRRVFVASSLLWRRVLDEKQAQSLWERLRRILSIALAVTTALLIALAIARPEVPLLSGATDRVAIVLDTSPTMLARTEDGRTRWQHAVEITSTLVSKGSASTEFRIADTSGRFDSAFTSDRIDLQRFIERIEPVVSSPHFPEVGGTGGHTYFISDGTSGITPPANTRSISVFEPANNVGITAFEIRAMPSAPLGYEAYLEVQNYSPARREVGITLSGAGRQRITRSVQIKPGESFTEPFDLSQFDGGAIRATVRSDEDAFPLDDIAYAYLPVKR